jgi:hypothetical protein
MKHLINSFKWYLVLFCFVFISLGFLIEVNAQTYNLSVGTNVSTYLYKNSEGASIDFLKRGSGSHFKLGSEFQLLDTTNNQGATSRMAIFFSQRQWLARPLTRIKFDVQVETNQINAVGDQQGIAFSYQTNFVGMSGGFGYHTPTYKNWSALFKGRFAVHKLIQGNQALGNAFLDLTKDDQFSRLQFFAGLEAQLQKKLNDRLYAFLSYQQMSTMHPERSGKPTLNFQTSTISFGIKILK